MQALSRSDEWESGGVGEWGNGRCAHSLTPPFPHSPTPPFSPAARLLLLAALLLAAWGRPAVAVPAEPMRLALVNMEGGWKQLGKCSKENLTRLRGAGVNAVGFWGTSMTRLDPRTPEGCEWWNNAAAIGELEAVGRTCKRLGLRLYFIPYLGTQKNHYPQVTLLPSKDAKGNGETAPSWFDPAYRKVIIARDRGLARLVVAGLANGGLMEPEVYGEGALMERGQLDFGDAAYTRFAAAMGMKGSPPPAAERCNWLLSSGLIGNYAEWQARDLRAFASEWARELRSVAPAIELGFYQPNPWHSWALRSLAQGMSDSKRPLLILDASTYAAIGKSWALGWEMPLREYEGYRQRVLKEWGVKARVVNGIYTYPGAKNYRENPLWQRCLSAEGIVAFLKESSALGNGWWIWNETGDPETVLEHIRKSTRQ